MSLRNYNNTSPPQVLTVAVDNSSGTTALVVPSTTGYPTAPFILGLERGTSNQEVCLCTAVPNGTTFTVVRGSGTPIKSHAIGATLEHTSAAIDYAEPNAFINLMNTVGDLIVWGSGGAARLGVGADGTSPVADHTQALGLAWTQVIAPAIVAHTAATAAPTGWLVRDGSAVSRTTYAALFAAISTTYGAGDGSTTFNVPDSRGRFDLGVSGSYSLGTTGGSATSSLSTANVPAHTHAFSATTGTESAPHDHETPADMAINSPGSTLNIVTTAGNGVTFSVQVTTAENATHTHNVSGTTGTGSGSGSSFNTISPYQALTPIIKY